MSSLWIRLQAVLKMRQKKNGLLVLLSCIFLQSCYLTKLAFQHNNQFNSRRLVSSVIADPQTNAHIKQKLILFNEIMEYAKVSLCVV